MPDTVMTTEAPDNTVPSVRSVCFTRSPEFKNFIAAFLKAQATIKGAKKDSKNDHFKSSYADLESVVEAIGKPLNDNGLVYMQWPVTVRGGIELETILFHTSGEWASGTLEMPAAQVNAHGIGSAITYARRYGLMAAVGLAPIDDDGNAASLGAPGSAGGGGEFRPAGPRKFQGKGNGWVDDAVKDGLVPNNDTRSRHQQGKDAAAPKGALGGRAPTVEEARAAKIKAATDKRITALKQGPWVAYGLKKFWDDDAEWRDWMADPNNEALADYERYTTAYTEAKDALPVDLA